MEEYYLILYLGNDYIVPHIDSNRGNFFRYRNGSENRLWLYFHEDVDSTDVLYGQDYYRPARMGTATYYGNYWKCIEQNETVSVHGVTMPYIELARSSGIIKDLKEWYNSLIHNQPGDIPVVCVYADTVPFGARKSFMKMLQNNGLQIRSYSLSFNRLIARYCNLRPDYGKQIALLAASGDKVQLSSMIYWNDEFVSCGNVDTVEYNGEDPVKMALVQHVVDTNHRQTGFFNEETIIKEYVYQMQYADEWLKLARNTPENGSFLITYHISLDTTITYQINIRKSFITSKQEECAGPIINGINRYCNVIGDNNILQYVFTGDIFSNEEMYRMSSRLAPAKSVYIDSAYYGDILHLYSRHYFSLSENVDEYETVMEQRQKEHDSATAWLELAERITGIANKAAEFEPEVRNWITAFAKEIEVAGKCINASLEHSRFDDAQQTLDNLSSRKDELKSFVSRDVHNLLNEHVCNRSIYDRVLDYVYAERIINEINNRIKSVEQLIEKYENAVLSLQRMQDDITFYRDSYPYYLQLRSDFNRATTLIEKERIAEKMLHPYENEPKPVTLEPLPELPRDVQDVSGKISSKVNYTSGGFLGLCKKPSELEIFITLDQQVLPYHCIVVVSDEPIARIDRDKVCLDLEKGATGTVYFSVQLPDERIYRSKQLTIRVMVDTERNPLADISKVSFNHEYVNL